MGTPARIVAAIALLFLLAFRGLLAGPDTTWTIRMGFVLGRPDSSSLLSCVAFSFLSFALFLFQLWGVAIIFTTGTSGPSSRHTSNTLYYLARPFTYVRHELRPVVLLVIGIALVLVVDATGGSHALPSLNAPPAAALVKSAVCAIAGWTDVLMILRSAVFLMIIASWIATFSGSGGIAFFCREWMDLLLGPLRRYPLRVGPLDLSPWIFMLVISYAYRLLINLLSSSYNGIG